MTKTSNTPFLIFNKSIIQENAYRFKNILSENCYLLFSVKSFPTLDAIDLLSSYIDGFDISNEHEAKIVANWNKKIFSAVGPCLKPDLIEAQINKKIDYIYNDLSNISQFTLSKNLSIRVKVTDFITNLDVDMPSRFGVNKTSIKEIAENYNLTGFHFHASSHEMINIKMFENFFQFLKKIKFNTERILNINIGGGWYISSIDRMHSTIKYIKNFTSAKIFIEPGFGFFYNSGYAVCTIINIDKINNITYVTTDISPDIHLKWSTPYLIDKNYSDSNFFYLCGSTCFEGDTIKINGDDMDLKIGKTLILGGICSYSVGWNTSFNGIQPVAIFFN
jgi:diaminopimelate decarboxylase